MREKYMFQLNPSILSNYYLKYKTCCWCKHNNNGYNTHKKKKLNNTYEYYLFEIKKYIILFGLRCDTCPSLLKDNATLAIHFHC